MIQAYVKNRHLKECLKCLEQSSPDIVSWARVVAAFAKAGAMELFHSMPYKNVITWNAMITGYKVWKLEEEKKLFNRMPLKDMIQNSLLYAAKENHTKCIRDKLGDCISQDSRHGARVNVFEAIAGQCSPPLSSQVDDREQRWSGYLREKMDPTISGPGGNLRRIQGLPAIPAQGDFNSLVRSIKSYGNSKNLGEARKVHARIERNRDLKESLHLWNLVIEMYGKCGSVEEARAVFDRISDRNLVSWNILLAAYARNGDIAQARCSDAITGYRLVDNRGCRIWQGGGRATELFDSMPHKNVIAWNAMFTGHEKAGLMEEAKKLFDCMPLKDVVSWNAMVAG
ncbi:pentatricopeptide repeat-containing protein At4g02750-like [Selaginella moellendorffii]|uniref:pentatricopeptide repeat-containing protein At4g02750-like n=1 Tax=Selaginella moellendorffii TaxID=88036 RepID=UPI000D1CEFD6|nr:pentatricopeptide repeat-containing protein At4g02750-like [Selaginella moellendorffii]|eukprot:XP_024539379.1 pentatricopeptide repeat-containing protein At4g02750-like [Selaginella moellendorffii]